MSFFKRHASSSLPNHPTHPDDDDTENEAEADIDPELRLRTVRTAASTIAESIRSEQRVMRRKKKKGRTGLKYVGAGSEKRRFFGKSTSSRQSEHDHGMEVEKEMVEVRESEKSSVGKRNVFINLPLKRDQVDASGEPLTRYVRNKVRTTKYTILTFIPKNLYEQFRRVANLYFLLLVVIQVFPLFGAAAPSLSALPLIFILTVSAVKDGVEDYRRAVLDDQVNNSAATKLGGGWRNVNQPSDSRSWVEKFLGLNRPGSVSKGVRKLRTKEAELGLVDRDGRVVLTRAREEDEENTTEGDEMSMRRLEDIQSVDSHTYPPQSLVGASSTTVVGQDEMGVRQRANSMASSRPSTSIPSLSAASSGLMMSSLMDGRSLSANGTARWERTLWKKLEVGDLVLLRDNDQVPADIVVLSTSGPGGICYLETKNLDGETNLKPRKSLKATSNIRTEEDLEKLRIVLESEGPRADLYVYNGVLRYGNPVTGETQSEPITINELLLRGCSVRNTSWIIGLVVFTGSDTKIFRNGGSTPSKRSKIEKETNFNVIVNFVVLMGMCIATSIASGVEGSKTDSSAAFFEAGSEPSDLEWVDALVTFASGLIAFQNIVPISLYISIEIVKTVQAYFIAQDVDMYYAPLDSGCVPKTWNISDDLGQIEYIFSDKTGTLTRNVMQGLRCSVGGVRYGVGGRFAKDDGGGGGASGRGDYPFPSPPPPMESIGGDSSPAAQTSQELGEEDLEKEKEDMLRAMKGMWKNRYLQEDQLTLVSPALIRDLSGNGNGNGNGNNGGGLGFGFGDKGPVLRDQRTNIVNFCRALAVCHSVLAERKENHSTGSLGPSSLRGKSDTMSTLLGSTSSLPTKSSTPGSSSNMSVDPTFVHLEYKAESPDETALVSTARDLGFPFLSRTHTTLDIEVLGQSERYQVLKILEFTSARKRMSVVVRTPEGKLVLYMKGADSVVYARLAKDQDPSIKKQTELDMEYFASCGLRTLCVGARVLSEEEYFSWVRKYEAAQSRAVGGGGAAEEAKKEEIERVCDEVEKDVYILGATALEDKLQEGVPEAIEMLHRAGIRMWILTGDKVQTAIEIGFSCNLLKPNMDTMIISAISPDETRSKIEAGLNKIASVVGPPNPQLMSNLYPDAPQAPLHARNAVYSPYRIFNWLNNSNPRKNLENLQRGFIPRKDGGGFAVVIDGDTLKYALGGGSEDKGKGSANGSGKKKEQKKDLEMRRLFLNLVCQCETVVCCRVSPSQKAEVVRLVKEGRNAMTLSIGDGANDVAMIQEAHIGCGLFGLEGSQAAMSADYAFAQFRFLTKLLLVHGHWSYLRIANMHANFFYKNVIWTFAMFWFLFWNNFDATYLYEYTFILLYNLVFTSLPVMALGAFDQDLNSRAILAFPQLYLRGIRGLDYTRTKFWLYMLDGFYQSGIVFFIPFVVWQLEESTGAISWNGRGIDSLADFGTTIAVAAIVAANLYVGLNTHYWTVITWILVIGSSVVMMVWVAVYSLFNTVDFNDEVVVLYGEVTFWATVMLCVTLALAPRFLAKFISSSYSPLDREIVREMWVLGDLKEQLGLPRRRDRRKAHKTGPVETIDITGRPREEMMVEMENTPMYPSNRSSTAMLQTPERGVGGAGRLPGTPQSGFDSDPYASPQIEYHPTPVMETQALAPSPRVASSGSLASPPSPSSPSPMRGMMAPSPDPSYYSVSDIPIPSPLPSPRYTHFTRERGGEMPVPSDYSSSGPSGLRVPASRRTSLPLAEAVQRVKRDSAPSTGTSGPPSRSDGVYEMRVWSPPPVGEDPLDYDRGSTPTRATYANGQSSRNAPPTAYLDPSESHPRHHQQSTSASGGSEYLSALDHGDMDGSDDDTYVIAPAHTPQPSLLSGSINGRKRDEDFDETQPTSPSVASSRRGSEYSYTPPVVL